MGNLILNIKESKMKSILAIALIAICVSYTISAPSCQASDYCTGCAMSTTNSCTACFAWGSGSVGARGMATVSGLNNCIAVMPSALVTTDCRFYNGLATSTATAKSNNNCAYCEKKYLTFNTTNNTETCSDTAVTGCPEVNNAQWTKCYIDATGTVAGAGWCKKGYYGTGTANNAGYPTCTKASLANCDWAAHSTSCIYCKSNYAVSSTGACAAFTTDSNCRALHTDSTCSTCYPAYYWNTTKCKLGAGLLTVAFLAVAAFFN